MIPVDLNIVFLIAQIANVVLFTVWLALAVMAWRKMRRYELASGVALGWMLVILFVPVFGALTFLSGKPIFGARLTE